MKAKHLFLAIAVLLAAGGLWFAWSAWRTHALRESSKGVGLETQQGHESSKGVGFKRPNGQPKPGQMPRPPEANRRFTDFTPEQRVQFARQGHGPGG